MPRSRERPQPTRPGIASGSASRRRSHDCIAFGPFTVCRQANPWPRSRNILENPRSSRCCPAENERSEVRVAPHAFIEPECDANLTIARRACGRDLARRFEVAGIPLMRTSAMPLAEDAAARKPGLVARTSSHRGNERPRPFIVSPFLAVLAALAAGIAIDRFIDPWATRKWIRPGAGLHVSAVSDPSSPDARSHGGARSVRRAWRRLASLSIFRHGARRPGRSISPRPADRYGFAALSATLRGFVLARALEQAASRGSRLGSCLTSVRFAMAVHGTGSRAGRSRSSLATGSEILAGQSVEAAGQLALSGTAAESGRIRLSRLRASRGNSPAIHGRRARRASGARESGSDSWSARAAGPRPLLEPRPALRAARSVGRTAGRRADSRPARGNRTRSQRRLRANRHDSLACDLGAPVACFGWRAPGVVFRLVGLARRPAYLGVGLAMIAYAAVVGPAPSVVRATVMTATFCLACDRRAAESARQHAGPRRARYSGRQSLVSFRRRVPALVPGNRRR